MSCTICQHPQRQAIDQALVAGSATLANLSQQYNLSTSALHRHKAHLKAKVSRAQTQLQDNLRQGCIFWLSQAIDLAMQTAKAAQAEGNSRLVLQALAQGTRLVTIILKQDLNLDDRLIYEILANPQWASQDSLLPADPNIMSLSRQSLAETLSSPCPEIASQNSNAVSQEDRDLYQENPSGPARTHPPKLRTQNSGLRTPLSKREKGGKKVGKNHPRKGNIEGNQPDMLLNKITGIMDFSPLARSFPGANPQLDALFETSGPIPKDKPLSEYIYEQSLKGNQEATKGPGHSPGNGKGTLKTAI